MGLLCPAAWVLDRRVLQFKGRSSDEVEVRYVERGEVKWHECQAHAAAGVATDITGGTRMLQQTSWKTEVSMFSTTGCCNRLRGKRKF